LAKAIKSPAPGMAKTGARLIVASKNFKASRLEKDEIGGAGV
jgi:hypothetical protein